ncbi:MAG: iron-containing alcohol dehydrogenase [Deltaproteobacteria bacterium]|nr:iron-containing alcohol dehydrogenase [Deltaproteobacteria bacterium]MBW2307224.1 iron-containing alcohol dehydrogenase [Deltaproteobacteria bacterium]
MFNPDSVFEFSLNHFIKFGAGAAEEIGYEVTKAGGTKALIVTDRGVKEAGLLQTITEPLEHDGILFDVFDSIIPEPTDATFMECVTYARRGKYDVIIGLGGGSSIDVAKTTGILLKHGGELIEYIAPPTGGGRPIPGPGIPVIGCPTTAGTGSEVSPASVISLKDEKLKVGISSPYQRPVLALVDPCLCVSMSPAITAFTGMDALSHAIECYVTRKFDRKAKPDSPGKRPVYGGSNPFTDVIALKAVELVSENLRRACDNGEDLDARWGMSLASLLAGIAFTNSGLGLVHAMALSLGGKFPLSHGEAVATLLPAVMEYNACSDFSKFADIASVMGEDTLGMGRSDAAMMAARAVKKLADDIGIPAGLKAFGVKEKDIPLLAEGTLKIQRLLVGNPRKVSRAEQVEEVLKKLF